MSEQAYPASYEMTLRDYLRILFRHKMMIFFSVVVTMTVTFFGTMMRTPMYEAGVKMLVMGEKQVEASYYKELMSSRQMQASLTQSEIVTSDPILQRVVDVLHLDQKPLDFEKQFASPLKAKLIDMQVKAYQEQVQGLPEEEQKLMNYRRAIEELRNNVKVAPVRDTNVFMIKVKDYDRFGAAAIANVVSRSYVIFDLEQQLAELQLKYGLKHPVLMQLQDNIRIMTENLSGRPLENSEAIGPASVKIIEQAGIPLRPIGQTKKVILLVALLTSIFVGMALTFVFEYLDQTIKSPRELEGALGVSFFGAIPPINRRKNMFPKGTLHKWISQQYINSYYHLIDQIHLISTTTPVKSILIVSPESNDETGLITAHLAYHLSDHLSKNVLVIDANYRKPSLAKIFELGEQEGLVEVLTGKTEFSKTIHAVREGLFVVPAGKAQVNAMQLLDLTKMHQILESAKERYDLVFIVCSHLKSYNDGYLLASMVDKTLFVVSENETRKQVAAHTMQTLKKRNAPVLGAILSKRTFPIPKVVYEHV